MSSEEIRKIESLIAFGFTKKVRVNELLTGDVVNHSICKSYLYVVVKKNEIVLYPIQQKGYGTEIRWQTKQSFHYGLNCQMWVLKKVSSRVRN